LQFQELEWDLLEREMAGVGVFISLIFESLSCDLIRPIAEFDDGDGGVLLRRFELLCGSKIELVP